MDWSGSISEVKVGILRLSGHIRMTKDSKEKRTVALNG